MVERATTSGGGLVKTSTQLSPEQLAEVERIADRQQVSGASVIRTAVREYLEREAEAAVPAKAA